MAQIKESVSATSTGDVGLIPRLERSPGEGNGNTLQYSCLRNPLDREASWATVHRAAKSGTQVRIHACTAHIGTLWDVSRGGGKYYLRYY